MLKFLHKERLIVLLEEAPHVPRYNPRVVCLDMFGQKSR